MRYVWHKYVSWFDIHLRRHHILRTFSGLDLHMFFQTAKYNMFGICYGCNTSSHFGSQVRLAIALIWPVHFILILIVQEDVRNV